MSPDPFGLPASRSDRDLASIGQRLAATVGALLLTAVRMMVVVVLRLSRPLVMYPLLLGMVGGLGAVVVFGFGHHWRDAGQAGLVSIVCAVLVVAYSQVAMWIDPVHFDLRPIPSWRRYL